MDEKDFLARLRDVHSQQSARLRKDFNRHVSFGDVFTDRWQTAESYGFGEGTTCYDNVLILGDVKVGKNCWIGPNCVLDGSGGLEIGDYCSISAGVQIYTHHTVNWATSLGQEEVERSSVRIGSGVYIGPQAVVQMGIEIGDQSVIGACSFVNKNVPSGATVWGCPASIINKS